MVIDFMRFTAPIATDNTVRDCFAECGPQDFEDRAEVFDAWMIEHDAQVRDELLAGIEPGVNMHTKAFDFLRARIESLNAPA